MSCVCGDVTTVKHSYIRFLPTNILKNNAEAFPFALNFVNESISLTIFPSNLKNWKQKERRILANGEM